MNAAVFFEAQSFLLPCSYAGKNAVTVRFGLSFHFEASHIINICPVFPRNEHEFRVRLILNHNKLFKSRLFYELSTI